MKINKKAFSVLIINFILLTAVSNIFAQEKKPVQPEDTLRYKKNPIYERQMEMFDLYKTRQADIVMFGNSLTAGADWSELLGRSNVATRGIPSLDDIESSYFKRGGTFLVLEEKDGPIIGAYGLFPLEEKMCELRKMYLHKAYRGKGLGKFLMDDALARAKHLGFKKMVLETASVLKEAIALYKHYGFTEYQPDHLSSRCDQAYSLILK